LTQYRVRLVKRARTDLAEAKAWLTQPGSGDRGARRYAAIIDALLDLEQHPLRWPLGEHADFRERPVQGHRILYRVHQGSARVEIVRIFGPYQDRSSL
jgi:plasmid stabilization system protein ParE